jgi:ABC-type multidrug transport system fused ATPase/permease subunit
MSALLALGDAARAPRASAGAAAAARAAAAVLRLEARAAPARRPARRAALAAAARPPTRRRAASLAVAAPAAATAAAAPAPAADEAADARALAAALSLRDLWALLRPDSRVLAACLAATLLSVGAFVCVAPALGRVIDVISAPGSTPAALARAVGALGAVYAVSNLALAAQVALSLAAGERLAARVRARLFAALLRRDAAFHDRARAGAMAAWLGQDVEVLQQAVARVLGARGLRAVLETVGIVAVLAWLSPPLAAALLLAAPLVSPAVAAATARIRGAARDAAEAGAAAAAAADEAVDAARVVAVFGARGRELARYRRRNSAAHAANVRVIRLQAALDAAGRARNTLCVLATLGLGAHLALAGRVTVGVCYSFFVYAFSFAFALSNVTNTLGDLAKAAGTVARTLAVLRRCEGAGEGGGGGASADGAGASARPAVLASTGDARATPAAGGGRTIPAGRLRGGVEFRGVEFAHPGGWALGPASFAAPPGGTLALVGPSGGGKSTIAALLLGLYAPTAGRILVDGEPLAELDLRWWRRRVGVVEQAPALLAGRVRDVVAYGRPGASDAEVWAALEAAQAAAFVRRLPRGLDAPVGAGGAAVSGGQRQRLAVARAVLKRPALLLLDEATSALDVGTETDLARSLAAALPDATKIVIAHRLSTGEDLAAEYKCVVVLDSLQECADAHSRFSPTAPSPRSTARRRGRGRRGRARR